MASITASLYSPNGARKSEQRLPVIFSIITSHDSTSFFICAAESLVMCGCVPEWLPISCPRSKISLTMSGYFSTQKPHRKNVAFAPYWSSVSSMNAVLSSSHAASMVMAIFFSSVCTLYTGSSRFLPASTSISYSSTEASFEEARAGASHTAMAMATPAMMTSSTASAISSVFFVITTIGTIRPSSACLCLNICTSH